MKKIVLSILLLVNILISYSQESFPKSWIGKYKGNLEIYAVDSIAMRLKMELDIQSTSIDSVYNWTITYDFKGQKDIRSYQLIIVNAEKGIYQIDEKNSIIIDAFYRKNIFTSFFEVMNSFIIATYTKSKENTIIFEIISAKANAISTTGGEKINDEEIPEVKSYQMNGRQRAILYKIPQ
jgi:hypothetical protein